MKKLCLAGVAMVVLASGANALDSTGCGWGSNLFKGKSGVTNQVLAVTTNMTSGNQTFGITFGTVGCDPEGTIKGGTNKMALSFIENNMEQFAMDVSSGNGETIETLAGIFNIDSDLLGKKAQENFVYLFSNENVKAAELTLRLIEITKS